MDHGTLHEAALELFHEAELHPLLEAIIVDVIENVGDRIYAGDDPDDVTASMGATLKILVDDDVVRTVWHDRLVDGLTDACLIDEDERFDNGLSVGDVVNKMFAIGAVELTNLCLSAACRLVADLANLLWLDAAGVSVEINPN